MDQRGGSGDKGVDIVAEFPLRGPITLEAKGLGATTERMEIWAVECKDWPNRTISRQRLWGQTAAVDELRADVFLLLTTGRLSPDAKDHVRTHNRSRHSFRIVYMEGEQLDLLFREAAIQPPYVDAGNLSQATLVDVQRAWHTSRSAAGSIRAVQSFLRPPLVPRLRVAYLEQAHRVDYLASGHTRTELTLLVVNLDRTPLREDVVRFQGNEPLAIEHLGLEASQRVGRRVIQLEPEIRLDTGNHLVVSVPFAEPVAPLQPARYTVSVTWPFALPLQQLRYYGMPTFRLTKTHRFAINVPLMATPTDAWLIHDVDGAWTKLAALRFEKTSSSWFACGYVRRPALDDRHVVAFTLT